MDSGILKFTPLTGRQLFAVFGVTEAFVLWYEFMKIGKRMAAKFITRRY